MAVANRTAAAGPRALVIPATATVTAIALPLVPAVTALVAVAEVAAAVAAPRAPPVPPVVRGARDKPHIGGEAIIVNERSGA